MFFYRLVLELFPSDAKGDSKSQAVEQQARPFSVADIFGRLPADPQSLRPTASELAYSKMQEANGDRISKWRTAELSADKRDRCETSEKTADSAFAVSGKETALRFVATTQPSTPSRKGRGTTAENDQNINTAKETKLSKAPNGDYRFGNIAVEWFDRRTLHEPVPFGSADRSGQRGSADQVWQDGNAGPRVRGESSRSEECEWTPVTSKRKAKLQRTDMADRNIPQLRNAEDSAVLRLQVDDEKRSASPQVRTTDVGNENAGTEDTILDFTSGRASLDSGILHLYRDEKEVSRAVAMDENRGRVVCVLAVPSYMTASDFLAFVGQSRKSVSHFRIIRDVSPNKFMVLAKFREAKQAGEFYKLYNGKQFNSMEPEICHVVYVRSVELKTTTLPLDAFPFLHDDHGTPQTTVSKGRLSSSSISTPQLSNSQSSLNELPTCAVCLERMDASVSGLLTILCQHTFHCHCLTKWGGSSCPVCRYSQTILHQDSRRGGSGGGHPSGGVHPGAVAEDEAQVMVGGVPLAGERNQCEQCGSVENLWICLICGNIGCGRYQAAHAHRHYMETCHLYALELETQRVWDYAGDGYVHRLIQNKADGKLVELPGPEGNTIRLGQQEKLNSIGEEYTYLLTTQLESQRLYYETQLASMAAQASSLTAQLGRCAALEADAARAREREEESFGRIRELEEENGRVARERRAADRRADKLHAKLDVLEKDWRAEKEMNANLLEHQNQLKSAIAAKDAQIAELTEQVRDLMFFLSAEKRIESSGLREEIQEGTVIVEPPPSRTSGGRRRKRK